MGTLRTMGRAMARKLETVKRRGSRHAKRVAFDASDRETVQESWQDARRRTYHRMRNGQVVMGG